MKRVRSSSGGAVDALESDASAPQGDSGANDNAASSKNTNTAEKEKKQSDLSMRQLARKKRLRDKRFVSSLVKLCSPGWKPSTTSSSGTTTTTTTTAARNNASSVALAGITQVDAAAQLLIDSIDFCVDFHAVRLDLLRYLSLRGQTTTITITMATAAAAAAAPKAGCGEVRKDGGAGSAGNDSMASQREVTPSAESLRSGDVLNVLHQIEQLVNNNNNAAEHGSTVADFGRQLRARGSKLLQQQAVLERKIALLQEGRMPLLVDATTGELSPTTTTTTVTQQNDQVFTCAHLVGLSMGSWCQALARPFFAVCAHLSPNTWNVPPEEGGVQPGRLSGSPKMCADDALMLALYDRLESITVGMDAGRCVFICQNDNKNNDRMVALAPHSEQKDDFLASLLRSSKPFLVAAAIAHDGIQVVLQRYLCTVENLLEDANRSSLSSSTAEGGKKKEAYARACRDRLDRALRYIVLIEGEAETVDGSCTQQQQQQQHAGDSPVPLSCHDHVEGGHAGAQGAESGCPGGESAEAPSSGLVLKRRLYTPLLQLCIDTATARLAVSCSSSNDNDATLPPEVDEGFTLLHSASNHLVGFGSEEFSLMLRLATTPLRVGAMPGGNVFSLVEARVRRLLFGTADGSVVPGVFNPATVGGHEPPVSSIQNDGVHTTLAATLPIVYPPLLDAIRDIFDCSDVTLAQPTANPLTSYRRQSDGHIVNAPSCPRCSTSIRHFPFSATDRSGLMELVSNVAFMKYKQTHTPEYAAAAADFDQLCRFLRQWAADGVQLSREETAKSGVQTRVVNVLIDGANVGYYGLNAWYHDVKRDQLQYLQKNGNVFERKKGTDVPPCFSNIISVLKALHRTAENVGTAHVTTNSSPGKEEGKEETAHQGTCDAQGIRVVLRPLIFLHQRHVVPIDTAVPPLYRETVREWEKQGILCATPTGLNDDHCWMYAAALLSHPDVAEDSSHEQRYNDVRQCSEGAASVNDLIGNEEETGMFFVTNDKMRDHHFNMFSGPAFVHWRQRHRITFFVQPRTDLPPHLINAGLFHQPVADAASAASFVVEQHRAALTFPRSYHNFIQPRPRSSLGTASYTAAEETSTAAVGAAVLAMHIPYVVKPPSRDAISSLKVQASGLSGGRDPVLSAATDDFAENDGIAAADVRWLCVGALRHQQHQ